MNIPKHYFLREDNKDHFVLHDSRDNSAFKVSKKDLHPAHQIKVMQMQKFESGGSVLDDPDTEEKEETKPEEKRKETATSLLSDTPSVANMAQTQALAQEPSQALAQSPQAQAPTPNYPTVANINALTNQYAKGVNKEVEGKAAQNDQIAQAYPSDQNFSDQQQILQTQMQDLNAHRVTVQKTLDDLSSAAAAGKIDPSRYMHDKGIGGQAMAAVAIALGGLAGGINRSGHNDALQIIQKKVDQDIDAQKEDLGNKRSLLSENLRRLGDINAAENATRLQMNAMLQGHIAKIAAQTNNPIDQARAQQNIAEFKKAMIPLADNQAQFEYSMGQRNQAMQKIQNKQADMFDLAKAGLVSQETAEKEQHAIDAKQKAENDVYQWFRKTNNEQTASNLANPQSYARSKALHAELVNIIMNASPSKRLTRESVEEEIEPLMVHTMNSDKTKEEKLGALIDAVRNHADPTPSAAHFGIVKPPTADPAQKYKMGPVK